VRRGALRLLASLGWLAACGDDDVPLHPVAEARVDAAVDGAASTAADAAGRDAGNEARDAAADAARADCDAVLDDVLLTCGAIVCHDPFSGGIGLTLDLSRPATLPDALFGLRSSDACGAVPYVDPVRPAQSLLIRKLDDAPPCGERMPAGDRPPLDATQRACFVQWVLQAAARAPLPSADDGGT